VDVVWRQWMSSGASGLVGKAGVFKFGGPSNYFRSPSQRLAVPGALPNPLPTGAKSVSETA
jgi:hypothetical protein